METFFATSCLSLVFRVDHVPFLLWLVVFASSVCLPLPERQLLLHSL